MNVPKVRRRALAEWALLIGVPVLLYLTGLHTEAIGGIQRVLLSTGWMRAKALPVDKQMAGDYDLSLVSLEGKKINVADLRGKVVFMNLWATWCPPCVAEMPGIQKLYEKVDSNQVVFVMLSLDEQAEKARKFIKKKGYTFPVYLLDGELPAVYSTASIPTTYVLAPNGQIVVRKEGMAEYDDQRFVDLLQKLAEKGR